MNSSTKRGTLVVVGSACVALAIIGVALPVLPTTPFLLAATYCFAGSSERLHRLLLNNRVFGRYLRGYVERRGLPLSAKVFTIALLWAGILVSVLALLDNTAARIILILIGAAVTLHVACIRPKSAAPAVPDA